VKEGERERGRKRGREGEMHEEGKREEGRGREGRGRAT